MDLESECSALESVEDNEVTSERERTPHFNESKIEINGSCANEILSLSSAQLEDPKLLATNMEVKDVETENPVNSPSAKSAHAPGESPPPTMKGYGLKKWRRIRRDFINDASTNLDSSKILKRGWSTPASPTRHPRLPMEINKMSEGSVESVNLLVRNLGAADIPCSNSDSRLAVGSGFSVSADSENSEDQSSKSSTAASAPKVTAASVIVREKNRMKNLSGRAVSNSVQRVQQGKGRIETSKKPRGDRVKIEKENSHSSMESDSRSSNFVFMQGASSAISNGKQIGRSTNHVGVNGDDPPATEQQSSEEFQTGYRKDNMGQAEDLSQDNLAAGSSWKVKEERIEDPWPTKEGDPLVDSVLTLKSVQEALEKEIKKLREIGKESISQYETLFDDSSSPANFTSNDPEICEPSSADWLGSKENGQNSPCSLETQVLSLKQRVKCLESKLESMSGMLKVKESKVFELEATLNSSRSQMGESGSNIELQQEKCREMETELEGLFKQKIEAEVEYLAIAQTIEKVRAAAEDQITFLEERKAEAGEQAKILIKLGEAEGRVVILKKQAEELKTYCGDILGTREVLRMQKKVCKVTLCFFLQLVLLVIVFGFLVLQLFPHSGVVVPT
ncbi:WPP domain-interacting protein 2-like [Malania oleifera]|uniref:WPP domain-interacting protein 2-like n=1 Tax=Malania oleifera TaxID=397392 RepID=UPI0025ADA14C|nr:WPP domain-interacting protein 2-like [Malania oleifera]